ncbi:sentrin-specific protease 1-like [Mercenaria mercenaria]|uniref:sentrin-specific protease 1-like n=1 Tax=Mercenaria mercenaria TaxID=6596 RepID=UPI00234E9E0B|nr:sentrin-specific protease 1-like [Mercenaria mercenaria]
MGTLIYLKEKYEIVKKFLPVYKLLACSNIKFTGIPLKKAPDGKFKGYCFIETINIDETLKKLRVKGYKAERTCDRDEKEPDKPEKDCVRDRKFKSHTPDYSAQAHKQEGQLPEAQDERRKSLSEDEVEIVEEEQESLPELTSEMENVINNALSPGNPDQVLVDKFHLQITKGDIARLSGSNWLNDVVINFYMNLLMERGEQEGCSKVYAFNTYFYPKMMSGGHSAVKTWTRRVDVLAVDYILIPVHLGKHWCLAVINFKKKDIQYYDSLGGINQNAYVVGNKILVYLTLSF